MRHPTRLAGLTLALSMLALSSPASAQDRPDTPPWSEEPPARVAPRPEKKPQIDLRWDVYYHVDELNAAMREIAAAYPDLLEIRTIGQSVEGRDILLGVLTDTSSGKYVAVDVADKLARGLRGLGLQAARKQATSTEAVEGRAAFTEVQERVQRELGWAFHATHVRHQRLLAAPPQGFTPF